jgi:squalene-hopene/tetraprenyl-beta-curcumene cyclase
MLGVELLLAGITGLTLGTQPTAAAGKYLDERAQTWFAFPGAARGQEANRTACVSCHTIIPYALGRPALRKITGTKAPTEYEQRLIAHVQKRVEGWAQLDTPKYGLFYDFNEQKKKESWGTEAVVNAVVLAFDDRYQGRTEPSAITRKAFANLWQVQARSGDQKGSWDWLDFGLEPWESKGGRYVGAALAALAVGTAPGYYPAKDDADTEAHVEMLRDYLKRGFAGQSLHNRAWALWASTQLDGILTQAEQKAVIDQLFAQQQGDGGWGLAALGPFARKDGTKPEAAADGYATGLLLHILQTAGVPKADARIARGLTWLKTNQAASGAWQGFSVNKKRDPTTHAGKLMTDAATGYAVLALSHP